MVERLGNVLYWTGCAAAAGFWLLALLAFGSDAPDGPDLSILIAAVGAGCWLLGRALRYILAGPRDDGEKGRRGRTIRHPKNRRPPPRPKRWADAVAELRTLQAEYETWRDQLPEALADSRTAELLEGVCDVDLDALDVELPRSFEDT